jgi:CRP-like cAMP-binding protein
VAHDLPKSRHVDLWQALHELAPSAVDPSLKTLFLRGDACRGIYMVEEGRVRLLLAPERPSSVAFEIAGPGSVLGLAETLSGADYKLTAQAQLGTRLTYIDRQRFLIHLSEDQHFCLQIVQLLSEDLHSLYHRVRTLLPQSGRSRPARA